MKVDTSQFHQAFFDETAEHLAEMERLLVALNIDNPDAEDLNAIFRAAHSVKGGSGIFGFTEMASVTHVLESLLDLLRKGSVDPQPAMIDASLKAGDLLGELLQCYRAGSELDQGMHDSCKKIIDELQVLSASSPEKGKRKSRKEAKKPVDDDSFGFFDDVATDNANDAGFGFFDEAPVVEKKPSDADAGFGFFDETPAQLASQSTSPNVQSPVMAESKLAATTSRATASESSSIRVSVEKTDQLINLVGELVITEAMLEQMGRELDLEQGERMHQALSQLARNTRQLQEAAMSLRMLPIGQIFSRFPRLVRDLAGKLGKQIDLVVEGESTELDKGLIEKLTDPLTHILRNSIDHGIETTAEREAAGKSARGKVQLRAFHRGGNVVIEVIDDGRGLNREKIIAKARERGFPVSDTMSDADVWQLIFEPGFSTADAITDVSGRGVGMDVVRRNINSMSGRVDIESWHGQGSRIAIRLPLTLAILDGMLVNVGVETYVVPLSSIVESLQPEPENISTVGGRGRLIRVRGEYIPLVALHEIFNIPSACKSVRDSIVVLLEAATGTFALQVDALAGQSQVVIKSLETNYRRVAGFSGATILGSGRVAMILDVDGLLRMSQEMIPMVPHAVSAAVPQLAMQGE
ncbi:MAG: chemotaxis protein CheA [Spongiibacteraceae bacterium]